MHPQFCGEIGREGATWETHVSGRITFRLIVNKCVYFVRQWSRLNWLRVGVICRLL